MLDLYKNIKKYRQVLGITQSDLAKLAGYKDKSMIAKIEKGLVDLPQSKIVTFANIFGIKPGELLGFDDKLEEDYINDGEYNALQLVFNELGYSLKPYSTPGNYTLRHNKETDFIVVISEYELKTMIYDISDYVGVLVSKKFESMLSSIRTQNELNAAHDRTDKKVTEADIKHDEDIMNDDNF